VGVGQRRRGSGKDRVHRARADPGAEQLFDELDSVITGNAVTDRQRRYRRFKPRPRGVAHSKIAGALARGGQVVPAASLTDVVLGRVSRRWRPRALDRIAAPERSRNLSSAMARWSRPPASRAAGKGLLTAARWAGALILPHVPSSVRPGMVLSSRPRRPHCFPHSSHKNAQSSQTTRRTPVTPSATRLKESVCNGQLTDSSQTTHTASRGRCVVLAGSIGHHVYGAHAGRKPRFTGDYGGSRSCSDDSGSASGQPRGRSTVMS
jgi:hypothetical protein